MAKVLNNTGIKTWGTADYKSKLLDVLDQLFGTNETSNMSIIDKAIGKLNEQLGSYYITNENNTLYLGTKNEKGEIVNKIAIGLVDKSGKVAKTIDETSLYIDDDGVLHGVSADAELDENSENAIQNKAVTAAIKEITDAKGAAGGYAELDSSGYVLSSQLPSYVDDVLEYDSSLKFPDVGESGKIYIATDTNVTYRWGGTVYVPIGSDLALGETEASAYRGDRGKIAYDHSQTTGNPHATTASEVGAVSFNEEQDLSDDEKATAQKNIGFDPEQFISVSEKNVPNGVPTLDVGGVIDYNQLPISKTWDNYYESTREWDSVLSPAATSDLVRNALVDGITDYDFYSDISDYAFYNSLDELNNQTKKYLSFTSSYFESYVRYVLKSKEEIEKATRPFASFDNSFFDTVVRFVAIDPKEGETTPKSTKSVYYYNSKTHLMYDIDNPLFHSGKKTYIYNDFTDIQDLDVLLGDDEKIDVIFTKYSLETWIDRSEENCVAIDKDSHTVYKPYTDENGVFSYKVDDSTNIVMTIPKLDDVPNGTVYYPIYKINNILYKSGVAYGTTVRDLDFKKTRGITLNNLNNIYVLYESSSTNSTIWINNFLEEHIHITHLNMKSIYQLEDFKKIIRLCFPIEAPELYEIENHAIKPALLDSNNHIPDEYLGKGYYEDFGAAWILYSNNIDKGFSSEEDAAIAYSKYNLLCSQIDNFNFPPSGAMTTFSYNVIKRAKDLNPKLKALQYISVKSGFKNSAGEYAYLAEGGKWEGSTAEAMGAKRSIYNSDELKTWIRYFKESPDADGVMFDEFGQDYEIEHIKNQMLDMSSTDFADLNEARNAKYKELIKMVHDLGMIVCINAPYSLISVGDWYEELGEDDIWMFESPYLSGYGTGWSTWGNGMSNIYDYYTKYYVTEKCKAKIWAMNWISGSDAEVITGEYYQKLATYCFMMGLCTGAHYVSVDGFGRVYDLPRDIIEMFTRGDYRKPIQMTPTSYALESGGNRLEIIQPALLSGNVNEEGLDTIYYTINNRRFTNIFTIGAVAEHSVRDAVKNLSKRVDGMTEDTRKNAQTYWRMAIDDWSVKFTYDKYTNLLEKTGFVSREVRAKELTYALVENSKGGLDLVFTFNNYKANGWAAYTTWRFISTNFDKLEIAGKTLEFGFSAIEHKYEDGSFTLPDGTYYSGSGQYPSPGFTFAVSEVDGATGKVAHTWNPPSNYSSTIGEKNGYAYKTKPMVEGAAFGGYMQWNVPSGEHVTGTITFKDVYLVDIAEHDDEITKKWYTNLFKCDSTWSMNVSTEKEKVEGIEKFNVEATAKNEFGSTYTDLFTADEVIQLRGKKLEIGCDSLTFSNGITGEASAATKWAGWSFGIKINSKVYSLFSNTKNKSAAFDASMNCITITIPSDADKIGVCIVSANQPVDTVMTANGVYVYNLSEEISVRGKAVSNSSMRVCRVSEDVENETPSSVYNALYITDKGRMYVTDSMGEKHKLGGIDESDKGTPGGVATLDESGKVPKEQIGDIDLDGMVISEETFEYDEPTGKDADTLEGHSASYFATKTEFEEANTATSKKLSDMERDVAEQIEKSSAITDDTTGSKYKLGIANGMLYIEEVQNG